jgi:hypothetical protein
MRPLAVFFVLIWFGAGCKKNADLPNELRSMVFSVHCIAVEENGNETGFDYQGEQVLTTGLPGSAAYSVTNFSVGKIVDSIKQITAGLDLFPETSVPLFSIRLKREDRLTDPFSAQEWTKEELDQWLITGKTFAFGEGPGMAMLQLSRTPSSSLIFETDASSNQGGYVKILAMEDYGSPALHVPYFGKKVTIEFEGAVYNNPTGTSLLLRNGKAVLLFQYYKF